MEVGSGEVWDDDGDNYFENLEINGDMISGGLFDSITFSTDSASGSNWVLRYVDAEFEHSDTFTYEPVDSDGLVGNESTVTISVTPDGTINAALEIAGELVHTMNEDGTMTFTAADIANIVDLDNTDSELELTSLSIADSDGGTGPNDPSDLTGTLTDNGDGTWTFDPSDNWNGTLNLDYTVTDGANEVSGTTGVTVSEVNDIPIGEDFTVAITDPITPINFVGQVSDIEDADESLGVVIRELPEDGTLLYNGVEVTASDLNTTEFDLTGLSYEADPAADRPASGILLGTHVSEDADISNWGEATDDGNVRTLTVGDNNDVTITITSNSDQALHQYGEEEPSHMGFGLGDADNNGINTGETITVDFDGAKVSYAEIGIDGMGGHFEIGRASCRERV